MKKNFLVLILFIAAFASVNAQEFKIVFVDNDNDETTPIITALTNSGYPFTTIDIATDGVPNYEDIEQYDMVLWYTGSNGTTGVWESDNDQNSTYNSALNQFAQNGGIIWVDGLDFLYNVVGGASDVFPEGSFIHDSLGISQYLAQSHVDDSPDNGVPQYDISAGNIINSVNLVNWTFSTLWYADGLEITPSATALYKMGPAGYALENQVTALYNQVGTATYITSGFRLGKLNTQTMTNAVIKDVLDYAAINWDTEVNSVIPSENQTISPNTDGTQLSAVESVGWDSREWKYSTTQGSGYVSFGTPETAKNYTPNFAIADTYYVICETTYSSTVHTTNEVEIDVVDLTSEIAPTDLQYILPNTSGNELTVTESTTPDSREWKYSNISGSGYVSFGTPETATTYTPNFDQIGTYYIVCQSVFGGTTLTSNEVQINVETDYKILFVNDDDNTDESAPIDAALLNSGYTYYKVNTTDSVPSYAYIQDFDMVLWYTGNDGITNLWETDNTFIDQIDQYVTNGGTFWLDGIDYIYDNYGSAPVDFAEGDFIYDKLGISQYLSQSHIDDLPDNGAPQMDITSENKITTLNPVKWQYSTLWNADGLAITNQAIPLYVFGDEAYTLAGQVTSLYKQENFGTYLTTGLRIAKLGDGSSFVQDDVNTIVDEVIAYSQEEAALYCDNLDETSYSVTETSGTSIKVPFSIDGGFAFNSDNIFTAYLSDETGSFASEVEIGTLNYTAGDTIFAIIPAATTSGTAYRVRVKASNPTLTSNDNGIDISITTVSTSISPADEQTIYVGQSGTELTVTETPAADSRVWKYSLTSGSDYVAIPTETATSYTPVFAETGTYYVICESTIGSSTLVSNEVIINVLESEITTGTIEGSPFIVTNTTGTSLDVPYSVTGFFTDGNEFTAYLSDETGDFATETAIGSLLSTTDGIINAEIPAGTISGTAYRIRVQSDSPEIIGTDNGTDLVIELTTSITNIDTQSLVIYPNPVSTNLILNIDNFKTAEIKIFDNLGRIIMTKNINTNSINVSSLQIGYYTIQVKSNGKTMSSNFIKK